MVHACFLLFELGQWGIAQIQHSASQRPTWTHEQNQFQTDVVKFSLQNMNGIRGKYI